MKKFRTLTALALTGAMVVGLTACGGETEETTVETTVAETSIEETTEASIVEVTDESIDETEASVEESVVEDITVDESPIVFSAYDVSNNSFISQDFISSVEVTNLEYRELVIEDIGETVLEYYCDASQDVVITFNSSTELTYRNLSEGIIWSSSNPVVDGASMEADGDTYTVTIPADIMTAGTNYVVSLDITGTGEQIVYICFIAE